MAATAGFRRPWRARSFGGPCWCLALMKIVATSCTIGSGGSGGVFGPSVFMGAMLGGAFGFMGHHFAPGWVINPEVLCAGGHRRLLRRGGQGAGGRHYHGLRNVRQLYPAGALDAGVHHIRFCCWARSTSMISKWLAGWPLRPILARICPRPAGKTLCERRGDLQGGDGGPGKPAVFRSGQAGDAVPAICIIRWRTRPAT